ncbi:MAG: hypothetical protein LBN42_01235 [Oscillospiraceae bacterium]|jgi:GTPase SAR1 family protein|nr:hypothetical protein [Oscillospiraceae bacterium]
MEKVRPNKREQPAKKNYFLGQGFDDIFIILREVWKANSTSSGVFAERYKKYGFADIRGFFWFVCAFSVIFFGSVFWLLTSIVMVVYLTVLWLPAFVLCSIVKAIDSAYLNANRIFTACPECKAKSHIPAYKCPNCGRMHTNLTPGRYGIFHRTCTCGEVLPSVFFLGRAKLRAKCKECGTPLNSREAIPICIPVIGGRSVGKTAFITAFVKEFTDDYAKAHNLNVEIYNDSKKEIYNEITRDYESGSTRMTARSADIRDTSSVSFSFFLSAPNLRPERLVHIYDIAGEVFTSDDENEVQRQYEYCHGIVFVIDPMSIPKVRFKYEKGFNPKDIAGIGETDINETADVFLNKLRVIAGLSEGDMSNTPIAIVLSKTDQPGLDTLFSPNKIAVVRKRYPLYSDLDIIDMLVRSFLTSVGFGNFLNLIEVKFKVNKFFICSAIGHTRDEGEYAPKGVMSPMEWLIRKTDRKLFTGYTGEKFADEAEDTKGK